jgi:four helix bundle protein
MDHRFRFEGMEIWKRAADASDGLFDFADDLDSQKRYRWAEQLRAAVLSITNNIAEGSGCTSKAEFSRFLGYAQRSVFESANILMLVARRVQFKRNFEAELDELAEISRMITGFRRSLS